MSPLMDPDRTFEVNVHTRILDTALEAIHRRCMTHGPLFADLAWLDPRSFEQVSDEISHKCNRGQSSIRAKMFSRTVEQDEGIPS